MAFEEGVIIMSRKPIDIKRLIRENPKVDAAKYNEVICVLEKLRKAGVKPKEYDIIQPFTRHYHDRD